MVWYWFCVEDRDDTLVNESLLHWFHGSFGCLIRGLIICILLILAVFFLVAGDNVGMELHGSKFYLGFVGDAIGAR